ncbi:chromosome segregation protein SMC [Thermosediminibacter oceani]|uniref:Chromosome partition protein Smc n=1 Tax=Thermosediminibacter oceani (strain ATCC BAA-1034 / DSM 16646 / JW/IW-1228P) TaxID=555079 RepID=D9S347_THEOJ|nr:chromosome segregation protein SMC [Thermosediminibacter oceani]ADL07824.1 chromosome segregation protein SMC [Thermosediminibacter oceani DSM 16646]
MYLKRVELQGFKSFADRIEIEFQPGINAIVGPNGSGKSNITDAIRWVLGEQSIKTLRGSKLEDVIFAGSHGRKPMGMAEVSIILDNSDHLLPLEYSEICITRRVFRSGESEFYLNKVPCRLRDIQELFMDTGIGKDGYSIISQGQVDEFLISRPEERRMIFEETAGIMKHRARKREAEKKLEETMANLTRVDDILTEIESQLEPLFSQREKALEYQRLSKRQKLLEVNLLLLDLERLQEKLAQVVLDLSERSLALEQIRNKKADLGARLLHIKRELDKKQEEYERLRGEFFNKTTEKKEIEKEKEWQNERLKRLKEDLNITEQKLSALNEKLESAGNNLNCKIKELEDKIREINGVELKLYEKEKALTFVDSSIKEKQATIDNLKGDVIDLLNSASEIKNMITSLRTMKDNLQKRIAQIDKELSQIDEANSLTSRELEGINGKLTGLKGNLSDLNKKLEHLHKVLEGQNGEYRNTGKLLQEKIILLNELKSRYRALEEINQNYEGYQLGVKNLLSHLRSGKINVSGIYGTVADIIDTDRKLETAIEAALGGALQNVVCDTEQNAKEAIEYLKRNNLGRVTFLPLSSVKPRLLSPGEEWILSLPGCIGLAYKLIEYDKKFTPVLTYLLGRVIVAEDMDSALTIARKTDFSIKVVTLEGEIINPGGPITGGSFKKSSLFLSRKREFREIKEKMGIVEEEISALKSRISSLEEAMEKTQRSIETLSQNIYRSNLEIAGLEKEQMEKKGLMEERLERQRLLKLEKKQIESEIEDIDRQILKVQEDISSIEEQNAKHQSRVETLQREIAESKKSKDELETEINDLRAVLNSLRQQELGLKYQIQNLEQNKEEWQKEKRELEQNMDAIREALESTVEKMRELQLRLEDNARDEANLHNALIEMKKQKEEVEGKIQAIQKDLERLQREEKKAENALGEYRVSEASLKIEIEHIEARLMEKYSMSVKDALGLKQDLGGYERMKQELYSVKDMIMTLGPVNLNAIDDYENLKSRYDFLKSQRDDLLQAKIKLDDLIKDLTKTMEEMFLDTFKRVKVEFQRVFVELFGGGKAELILDDEENPLDSGIEIIAQPPGKKLQNLTLLSGGERALTAIALLFSILNIKATPFCILDEIEAALDDANIDRFTRYLKKVSEHTQVIIITHRKGTMEVADALYGIAMEETAVSKLITVKLED